MGDADGVRVRPWLAARGSRLVGDNLGTSIVEVLVVMVVLLVGILAAIRLFPPGFASVRHAESMTMAGRLAQYEIERWKNSAQNLPDGVIPIRFSGGIFTVLNGQYPGPPVDDDNARNIRRIIGETTRIPFGGWSTGPESGSYYLLSFSPIDTSAGSQLVVRGGDLSRRIFDSDDTSGRPTWERLRPYQYGIDYGESRDVPKVCFRTSSQDRVYYLSCSWWEQSASGEPELRTATNLEIAVPAGTGGWIDIPLQYNATTFIGFDRYSDSVSRGFVELNPGAPWSTDDPYEFKLHDAVVGIISFNPLGYAQREFGRPLEARIDYDILDLEIIREDKRVPAAAPYRVNLTLNRIKQANETMEPDGTPYRSLHPGVISEEMLAVDLETTRPILVDRAWINYKDGIVELPNMVRLGGTPVQVPVAGRNIRFFYKAEGDWSLQFHKAYAQYQRDYGAQDLDYRSYTVDSTDPARLMFAACNANSTIAVDYEYTDASGRTHKVVGESHKTSDALVGGRTYIDLREIPTRIFSVTGISARARVIWRDGTRWRYVDLDTTLVRRPVA